MVYDKDTWSGRFLGGSMKRKERIQPKPQLGECLRGALSWLVDVHEYTMNQRITCILGVSAETLVLLEIPTGIVIFTTSTHSIIGWANTDMGYDFANVIICYVEQNRIHISFDQIFL